MPERNVLETALQIICERKLRVFCDRFGIAQIELPELEENHVWPLHHPRVKAWLVCELHAAGVIVEAADLKEIPLVVFVLEGQAWNLPRGEDDGEALLSGLESDVVAAGIIAYANLKGAFHGLTRDLMKSFREAPLRDFIRCHPLASKWPVNVQQFSLRLRRLVTTLGSIGLDVTISHVEDGSHTTVRINSQVFHRDPDALSVSSSASVNTNEARPAGNQREADGTDACFEVDLNALTEELCG